MDEKIYGATGERPCTCCGTMLLVNTENFYTRTRENGRKYFTAKCKECIKSKRAAYRSENPDVVAESAAKTFAKNGKKYNSTRREKFRNNQELRTAKNTSTREWQKNNSEHVIAYRRAYRIEFREVLSRRASSYYTQNPGKFRAYRQARKGRIRGAEGSFKEADLKKQFADQFGCCFWCRNPLSSGYHADHYIPVSKGGSNKPYNIVLSCQTCNISRGAKMPVEFFAYRLLIAGQMPRIEMRREYFKQNMRKRRSK